MLDTERLAANKMIEHLRTALALAMPGGWMLSTHTEIHHRPGCDCSAADAYTIEPSEQDEACPTGESFPVLMLDDGSYTLFALRLDKIANAVRAWSADPDLGDEAVRAAFDEAIDDALDAER